MLWNFLILCSSSKLAFSIKFALPPLKIWSIFVDVSRGEKVKNEQKINLPIYDRHFFQTAFWWGGEIGMFCGQTYKFWWVLGGVCCCRCAVDVLLIGENGANLGADGVKFGFKWEKSQKNAVKSGWKAMKWWWMGVEDKMSGAMSGVWDRMKDRK